MTHDLRKFSDAERAFHRGHSIEDSYRPDCRMCGGVATQTAPVTSVKVHDPLCPHTEFIPCCESYLEHETPQPAQQHYVPCQCDLIARVRADQDMIGYAKHLELDYERTGESWEAGYKMGREHEREACIKIVQTVGVDHQNNAGRNVWRNEALVKLGYTGHI